jgi:hypothetical protein
MRIVLDPRLISMQVPGLNRGQLAGPTKVVVNVVDGGKRNKVETSVNGSKSRRMQQVLPTDPYMGALFPKHQGTEDAYSTPGPSSHSWELDLPASLSPRVLAVTVRSTNMCGRISINITDV